MKTYGQMYEAGEPLSMIFTRMIDLHRALGEAPVQDRLWRYAWTHDGHEWSLVLNGTKSEAEGVLPLHVMFCRDGLPAVLTDMFDGSAVWNLEDAAMSALNAEIERAEAQP